MRNKNGIIILIIAISIICFAGYTGFLISEKYNNTKVVRKTQTIEDAATPLASDISEVYSRDSFDGSISYQGNRYEKNTAIDTVLFLGIDSSDQSRDGLGIDEGGRSDTIILFAIDNENETITPLQINRDTMVDVDIYDNDGNFVSQGQEQITMQYAYGRNTREACNLTKEKISDLMCRTRIDGVISLTMEGIAPIVDSIGGVTLQLATDETDLDPSYVKGAVIYLDGTAAEDFVHIRDTEVRGSNVERMSRQTQFMLALFQNLKGQGSSIIETMESAAGDSLYEDIDADSMARFTRYDYAGEVVTLAGTVVNGPLHDEFYVDEEKVTETVLKLFYRKL